jgi:Cdc6-like AAA superfamily ATPase
MSNKKNAVHHNDMPITSFDEDKLNFEPFAKRVAEGILEYNQKECFVISVEGQWGIGKTSFVNLVKNEIKKNAVIMHFNPWLITNIEQLVSTFFSDLIKTLNHVSFKSKLQNDIKKDIKKFASAILPDNVSIGVSSNKLTWNIRDRLKTSDKTLQEQKEKINEYLRQLEQPIVIIIDDIDRLMDKETELIFRLIKGIADFDNIIYILLFDRAIVSESLKKFKSEHGGKYLDKIIQYPLHIPKVHYQNIRKILMDKLDEYLGDLSKEKKVHFDEEKWGNLLFILEKYIKTVRDVHKIFDTVSFEHISICEDVNFVDFFIISLLRIHEYGLYELIRDNPEYFVKQFYDSMTIRNLEITDREKLLNDFKQNNDLISKHREILSIIFPMYSSHQNTTSASDKHKIKGIADPLYFGNYFAMMVSDENLSLQEHFSLVDLLIDDFDAFVLDMGLLTERKKEQFFEMFQQHSLDKDSKHVKETIIQHALLAAEKLDIRNYFEDQSYCEFAFYNRTWVKLALHEIETHPEKREILEKSLSDPRYALSVRCLLRTLSWDSDLRDCADILNKYEKIYQQELDSMDIEKFLEYQYLDLLIFCMNWLHVSNEKLKTDFKDRIFQDKNTFFMILKKFVFKQISMPRKKYPYSISKEALQILIQTEEIQSYIESLVWGELNEEQKMLINFWNNAHE